MLTVGKHYKSEENREREIFNTLLNLQLSKWFIKAVGYGKLQLWERTCTKAMLYNLHA